MDAEGQTVWQPQLSIYIYIYKQCSTVRRDNKTQPLPASDYIRTRCMPPDRLPTATLQTCTNGRGATMTRQEWASPCVQDGFG